MSGFLGASLVCLPTPLEAARTTCASDNDCISVRPESFPLNYGGLYLVYERRAGGTESIIVQPCELNTSNPFVLSVADAMTVSGLILAVWAVAYVARMMVRPLFDKDTE